MITDSFDPSSRPLVRLEDFYGEKRHLAEKCLILFSREIYFHLLESFSCSLLAEIHAANGLTPIWGFSHAGETLAFYLSPIGSTGAAQYCIEANHLVGASSFIMFGSAGSLDAEKTAGRFVLPTEAYRDEGMSYHYAPPADYIAIPGHTRLAEIFDELAVPSVAGRVWTTDAFLRETVGACAARRAEGCLAVEMELAGVQAVCDFHGFALYDFLATGDVLGAEDYSPHGLQEANHKLDKLYLALEIAKRLD